MVGIVIIKIQNSPEWGTDSVQFIKIPVGYIFPWSKRQADPKTYMESQGRLNKPKQSLKIRTKLEDSHLTISKFTKMLQ